MKITIPTALGKDFPFEADSIEKIMIEVAKEVAKTTSTLTYVDVVKYILEKGTITEMLRGMGDNVSTEIMEEIITAAEELRTKLNEVNTQRE